jgi:type III restriction enzyme
MKFTLKDYQDEAVRGVLGNLHKARRRWHEDHDKHAFSLTAATGAGKTVMAAAAFEALFHGDDYYDFDADPGAVVIWFSDDPSLNEQTRFRLMEASDRLRHTDLVVVETTFSREKFERGKIYFLNTQKLGKNSLLVRGFEPNDGGQMSFETRPDLRSHTIWDTIRNTIEDPELTLYLVLDEAHRGMGNSSRAAQAEKSTIVRRLINGAGGVPATPIVLGISATVDRFNKAMDGAQGRSTLPNIEVDADMVQESGLLKDTIILDIPEEVGPFDTVLVRRAADKLKESTQAWAAYARDQGGQGIVLPLMVLQVPNTPQPDEIGRSLDTIFRQWPDLPTDSVAHVFGEHTTQRFGLHDVPYIEPQRVQESTWVRVLIAKDAISTGWDCPRAEVMVSFRAAVDRTHITQLLGRMVRTPLARRIPGDERLNSVNCLLPFFDAVAVEAVADALMKGSAEAGDTPPVARILINPKEMKPNPTVPDPVWVKFLSLPSQSRPQRGARPAKRLTALAHELAADDLLPDAGKKAHSEMHTVLDAAQVRYATEVAAKRNAVMIVEGRSLRADLQGRFKTFNQFLEDADFAVIDDAYRRAARALSPDIVRTYIPVLATRKDDSDPPDLEAFVEARADVAALGLVEDVARSFDTEADKLAKAWLDKYRIAIKDLSDERQEAYRQIREMSANPQDIDLMKPNTWMQNTTVRENGEDTPLETYANHLLCDDKGSFPTTLNSWEREVLSVESSRKGFSYWYRNPERASQESLGVPYEDNGQVKILRPDFLFFGTKPDGTVVADIVDPHATYLSDAAPKLKGLAKYAETHQGVYRRVDAVADVAGKLRVLDLTSDKVRQAVYEVNDVQALYTGSLAVDYE